MTSAPLNCASAAIDPGPSPLQLLSQEQYLNTLRDLFGARGDVARVLNVVPPPSAFGLQQPDVSQVELESFQKAAETVAAAVVSDASTLAQVVQCKDSNERNCARDLITTFAARAYRAPLTDSADIERHLALYDAGAKTSHQHGIALLLTGILQSPRFLYRVELGSERKVAANAVALSDHELAARLSYVFWKTLPDDTLRRAAEAGQLHTSEQLRAQVDRMLAADKGKHALREFLEAFMQLSHLDQLVKDTSVYPQWSDAYREQLRTDARAFFDRVLSEEGGTLDALLTSSSSRSDGDASGLLTLPAFLAIYGKPAESSPIYRGKFVRESLLCSQLPAPPANIPAPPEVTVGVSTRERLRQHEVDPSCSGCHKLLDPIGFGFEGFDGIGRHRKDDGGKAVDARGELVNTRDANGKFEGVVELGEKLASSEQVEACMAKQWFRFALGRFEQNVDACAVEGVQAALAQSDRSLHVLPHAIVASDAFLYRRPRVLE